MKEYEVKIKEISEKTIIVVATSQQEAKKVAAQLWSVGEFVIDKEDVTGAIFEAIEKCEVPSK